MSLFTALPILLQARSQAHIADIFLDANQLDAVWLSKGCSRMHMQLQCFGTDFLAQDSVMEQSGSSNHMKRLVQLA